MTIEAMKQALEALKEYCEHGAIFMPLTALKSIDQAIAEAEKQEPVAWLSRRYVDNFPASGYETAQPTDYGAFPVYTHPQPKQEQGEPVAFEKAYSLLLWDYQELERAFNKATGGTWIRKSNTPQPKPAGDKYTSFGLMGGDKFVSQDSLKRDIT
jgi:hypothetical protein